MPQSVDIFTFVDAFLSRPISVTPPIFEVSPKMAPLAPRRSLALTILGAAIWTARFTSASRVMIPSNSFSSQSAFDADWNYNYPWGTDHNGAARMDPKQAVLSSGNTLTITATKVSGQKPASHGGKSIDIHYLSGAVHAKEQFNVSSASGAGYDFTADFKAPVAKGTWPAFWLTAVNGWPPEIDIAEWKGSGKISFNTFNTSSQVAARDVAYPDPANWHTVKAELRGSRGDVVVKFYMDGTLVVTQVGKGFVGKPMYL